MFPNSQEGRGTWQGQTGQHKATCHCLKGLLCRMWGSCSALLHYCSWNAYYWKVLFSWVARLAEWSGEQPTGNDQSEHKAVSLAQICLLESSIQRYWNHHLITSWSDRIIRLSRNHLIPLSSALLNSAKNDYHLGILLVLPALRDAGS